MYYSRYLPNTPTQEEHEYLYFDLSQLFCSIWALCASWQISTFLKIHRRTWQTMWQKRQDQCHTWIGQSRRLDFWCLLSAAQNMFLIACTSHIGSLLTNIFGCRLKVIVSWLALSDYVHSQFHRRHFIHLLFLQVGRPKMSTGVLGHKVNLHSGIMRATLWVKNLWQNR